MTKMWRQCGYMPDESGLRLHLLRGRGGECTHPDEQRGVVGDGVTSGPAAEDEGADGEHATSVACRDVALNASRGRVSA